MKIALAIFLGTLFGYALQRVGAASADGIINMLRLKKLDLMKSIMFGVGLALTLLTIGLAVGLVDVSHLSVKAMYLGVPIGGALLGLGWALSGFCPGTSLSHLGSGSKDALFYILGGLVGAGIYMISYESFMNSSIFDSVLGGKTTLINLGKYNHLLGDGSLLFGIVIGLAFMIGARFIPNSLRN